MTHSSKEQTIDPSICPLCGKSNQCQMAAPLSKAGKSKAGKSEEIKAKSNNCEDNNPADSNLESTTPCWCVSESFPENYREQLAERDIDTRCICPGCLAQLSRR